MQIHGNHHCPRIFTVAEVGCESTLPYTPAPCVLHWWVRCFLSSSPAHIDNDNAQVAEINEGLEPRHQLHLQQSGLLRHRCCFPNWCLDVCVCVVVVVCVCGRCDVGVGALDVAAPR